MKMRVGVFLFVALLSAGVVLGQATPRELARMDLSLAEGKTVVQVVKIAETDGELYLRLVDRDGKKLCQSESLGIEDRMFLFEKAGKSLHVADLNSDNVPEIMAAAFIGPRSTGLHVFHYDQKGNKLVPLPVVYPEEPESSNLIVADVEAPDGSNLQVTADGRVTAVGLQYRDGDEPVVAEYSFVTKKNGFEFESAKKVADSPSAPEASKTP